MSTTNSDGHSTIDTVTPEQHRFLQLCVILGITCAVPFYLHPLGLQRPDAWQFTVLNHLLPFLMLWRFHKPIWSLPRFAQIKVWFKIGLLVELGLLLLLGWVVLLGHLEVDWTFQGFKDWTEVQIGQQIEDTELPMPSMPADFTTLAKGAFVASFIAPWFLWWVCLPQEMVWRGWVTRNAQAPKSWMILSTYWTLWQLPLWLLEPQWHWGWWMNNGTLFAQQVMSVWLVGVVLCKIKSQWQSINLVALVVALLTISETWAILIQQTVPFPNWLWIGWNGWWGCILMSIWLLWETKTTPSRSISLVANSERQSEHQ